MTDQLPIYRQMTLPGLSESISSPALAVGIAPSSLPAGPPAAPSGPVAAPVRPSAKPASAKAASDARARTLCGALDELATAYAQTAATHGLPMAGTYGRKPGALSHEVDRLLSLESRLQALTDLNGSPEYALRWKSSPMLLGAPIIRLRALARRISDSAFSGWPTPMAGSPGTDTYNPAGNTDSSRKTVELCGWPTARATDGEKNVRSPEGSLREIDRKGGPQDLCQAANLTGWSTPSTRDWKDTPGMATTAVNPDGSIRKRVDQLPRQALLASGMASTSSTAPTAKRAASLNPRFSGWLMGYPMAWCRAALLVPKASRSRKGQKTGSGG